MAASTQGKERVMKDFNELRQTQRAINGKIVELNNDLNEHSLVIDALKSTNSDRKCFQLIGGVLIEKKVKDVLPSVVENRDMINNTIESLKTRVDENNQQITEFLKKHPSFAIK